MNQEAFPIADNQMIIPKSTNSTHTIATETHLTALIMARELLSSLTSSLCFLLKTTKVNMASHKPRKMVKRREENIVPNI